jgi:hypothetical protein
MARWAAGCGVAVVGIVAALVLHDHQFASTFHMTANGVPKSYRAATLPQWRDPLALVCAFGGIAAAVLIAKRPQRLGLALGVVGCAFAGAVYLHQQAVHTIVCPPFVYGCGIVAPSPDLWHHTASLLVIAAGIAVALVLLLPRRWLLVSRLRLRHG